MQDKPYNFGTKSCVHIDEKSLKSYICRMLYFAEQRRQYIWQKKEELIIRFLRLPKSVQSREIAELRIAASFVCQQKIVPILQLLSILLIQNMLYKGSLFDVRFS